MCIAVSINFFSTLVQSVLRQILFSQSQCFARTESPLFANNQLLILLSGDSNPTVNIALQFFKDCFFSLCNHALAKYIMIDNTNMILTEDLQFRFGQVLATLISSVAFRKTFILFHLLDDDSRGLTRTLYRSLALNCSS